VSKFKDWSRNKISALKEQIFYSLDKEIFDNKIKIPFPEKGVFCSITVKTSSQSKEEKALKDFLKDYSDEQDKEHENEDSKHMII
jgi:hypothetical protein